jgi:UDP-N-acetylglucosamine diphosphorylase/glucosamine-1-phosphate N-acetyltransferase
MSISDLNIVIMAGGEGKRMNSNIPKVLHNFQNVPILVRIIKESYILKPSKIIIITGKYDNIIKIFLKDNLSDEMYNNLTFVNQVIPNGTGDAIKCTLEHLNIESNVLILNGDMPLITSNILSKFICDDTNNIAKLLIAKLDNPYGYGRIIMNKDNEFISIREEKDCNSEEKDIKLVNAGIYFFSAKILKKYVPLITNINVQNEYYLTDIIQIIKNDTNIINITTYIIDSKYNFQIKGINTKKELELLENEFSCI